MPRCIEFGQNDRGSPLVDGVAASIQALPKIELHRHLEGSIRLETLVDIAREYGIEMPDYNVETIRPFVQMMPDEPQTMRNFMAKFSFLRQFFRSQEVVQRITQEAIIDAAEDNVKYLELRFTPRALSNIVNCTPSEAVRWVCEAAAEAGRDHDIDVRLIVSMNRHEGLEIGEETMKAALVNRHLGVVGLDLAGIEAGYSAVTFRDLFRRARSAGLGITLHAGEWEGAPSVWDAVGTVGADRIGHGIRVLEDPGIVRIVAEQGVVLEVCPTSNVDSGVVPNLASHPLPELHSSGIKVTINTDDPLVSDITLTDEMTRAVQQMGFTLDDLKQFTLNAAQAAFLPESERTALLNRFQEWLYPQDATAP